MDSIIASARTLAHDIDHAASESSVRKDGAPISLTTQPAPTSHDGLAHNDVRSRGQSTKTVVVVGGGKSAQDIATYLAIQNVDVTVVCNELDLFLASPKPLSVAVRQSRFLSVFWPTIELKTRLELSTGERVEAASVIASTGFTSSWDGVFDEKDALDIGLIHAINPEALERYSWNYKSLSNPPKPGPSKSNSGGDVLASGLYKGLVPAKRINMKDFAVNGAIYSVNSGYVFEKKLLNIPSGNSPG
ncbi:hypothetical protein MD484_g1698, partial [Candolleomyces efflorescens]